MFKQILKKAQKNSPAFNPKRASELLHEANKLFYVDKNDEEALVLYDQAIQMGELEALGHRAFCLQSIGYHDEAVNDFNKAIEIERGNANYYFARANSKKAILDFEGNITDLRKAVELSKVKSNINVINDLAANEQKFDSSTQLYESVLHNELSFLEMINSSETLKQAYIKKINCNRKAPRALTRIDPQATYRTISIVHFDDHQLFAGAVKAAVEKETSNFKIHALNEYYAALNYISEQLSNAITIDAVITDMHHPGPNGYEFASEVKHVAKLHGIKIPVLLLTMSTIENPRIVQGLEERVFDKHLTKEANSEEIIKAIELLCDAKAEAAIVYQKSPVATVKKVDLNWLRWVGILPAAAACYFLSYALVKFLDWMFDRNEIGLYSLYHLLVPSIASGIAAYYFVFVGTRVAPFYKKVVAQILMIIVVMISGIGTFLLIANQFKWDLLLETLGQLIGAVIAFNQIKESKTNTIS